MSDAAAPSVCPVCGVAAVRVYTVPRFLFKADPRDVRPVWHNHDGYSINMHLEEDGIGSRVRIIEAVLTVDPPELRPDGSDGAPR